MKLTKYVKYAKKEYAKEIFDKKFNSWLKISIL